LLDKFITWKQSQNCETEKTHARPARKTSRDSGEEINQTIGRMKPNSQNLAEILSRPVQYVVVYARWLHTPGNLTLSAYNGELTNRPFSEKCRHYKQSNIAITRELADYDHWGAAEIQERATAMAEVAARIWVGPSEPVAAEFA
jgi:hypothetical protein